MIRKSRNKASTEGRSPETHGPYAMPDRSSESASQQPQARRQDRQMGSGEQRADRDGDTNVNTAHDRGAQYHDERDDAGYLREEREEVMEDEAEEAEGVH